MTFRSNIDDVSFAEAAERFGVTRIGGHRDGFQGKSRGEIVEAPNGTRHWLKLVGWIDGGKDTLPDGEIDSLQPAGVAKPQVVRCEEWSQNGTCWRAMLMTLAASAAMETTPWRRPGADALTDTWLTELRDNLHALRNTPTTRLLFTPESLKDLLVQAYGYNAPTEATDWTVCHGDLTWSNLTAPTFTLLDWEHWGLAPRGYDIARLICCCISDPVTVQKLQLLFRDELNSPTGDVAILTAIAGWQSMQIDDGVRHTLDRIAQRILKQPRWLRRRWLGRAAPLLPTRRRWPVLAAELATSNHLMAAWLLLAPG